MSDAPDDLGDTMQRARALLEVRRFDDAGAVLRGAVAHHPNSPELWRVLAHAELGADNLQQALRAAEEAIAHGPEDEWSHRLASTALRRLGHAEQSVHHAREAVRIEPDNWLALGALARSLTATRSDLPEARAAAHRALALAPDQLEAHLTVGIVAAAARERSEAEAAFRRALAINPQSSVAHSELARLQVHGHSPGGLASAASGFATSMRLNPRAVQSRRNLEVVLRVFLAKASYLIFLDAYLINRLSRVSAHSSQSLRLLPALLLAIPAVYAWRFVIGLSPAMRTYLLRVLTREGTLRIAVVLEALAVAGVLAGELAPRPVQLPLMLCAALAALVGRLILWDQVHRVHRVKRVKRRVGRVKRQPAR